jgi:hypothetical protein
MPLNQCNPIDRNIHMLLPIKTHMHTNTFSIKLLTYYENITLIKQCYTCLSFLSLLCLSSFYLYEGRPNFLFISPFSLLNGTCPEVVKVCNHTPKTNHFTQFGGLPQSFISLFYYYLDRCTCFMLAVQILYSFSLKTIHSL